MPNKPWKKRERACAEMISGWRYPASVGGPVDIESEWIVGQVKEVSELSLSALTAHALAIEAEGRARKKKAILCVKLRSGKGVATPTLVICTDTMFREMFPSFQEAMKEIAPCANPEPPPTSAPGAASVKPKETHT